MKKLFLVLMALMCMFSLCACGSGEESGSDDSDSIVVKIGGSGPLTGGGAVYGNAVKNAVDLAVSEINASDSKIKFEVKFEDDEADGEKAVTAYSTLYDWEMQVSLFTVTSGSGAAVASLYDEDKIFALTPSGSSTELVYTNDKNFAGNFQMCFTDPNQGVAAADYISEHFADKKVGIIYKNDDVYSSGIYEKFIAQNKVNVVYTGAFDNSSASDFNTQLTACKDAGADLVFMPIYYQPASLILVQAAAMGYEPTFFGVDGMDGILTLEGFDISLAEGLYLLTPFAADATDDLTVNFVTNYKNAYGDTPNQFAADAYDCVYAIHQALENIGVDNIDTNNLYEPLIEQFTTMSFDGLTGNNMTWSSNGEVSKEPKAVIIKDGVYVSAE